MNASATPRIIALAGPSGSGKSLFAASLRESLGIEVCTVLPIDSYYRDLGHLPTGAREEIDFDHPDALDTERILADLTALRTGQTIARPHYVFATHTRSPISEALAPAPLILVEGIFALALDPIRPFFDETWYLEVDADTCLERRLQRDVKERGRDPVEVRARFERDVRPSIERWVAPQRSLAEHTFDGRRPIPRLLSEARARLPAAFTAPTAGNPWQHLPETYTRLGTRVGMAALGTRLERQASHWAGLHHQGEGLLRIERWIPIDRLIGGLLRYSGTGYFGRRNAACLRVEHHTLRSPAVPAALDGLTLLHLSDLHLDLETGILPVLLRTLPGLRYDLAVITGDFRNSTRGDFAQSVALTAKLIAALKAPVFGILGNHDFIEMAPGLEGTGLRLLLNEGVFIDHGGARLFLAGIDDPHFYRTHDLARAGCLPSTPETFRILLSHSPETYREAAPHFDCMLSGHTHGGQICLPGRIPIIRNGNCPKALLAGPWRFQNLHGYTSRGTGCCGVPVRFFCPPEITLHTLSRTPA